MFVFSLLHSSNKSPYSWRFYCSVFVDSTNFGGFSSTVWICICICAVSNSMYGNPECFSQAGSVFKTLVVLSALSCLLNCIPLVVAGRLFEECSLALAFKPTIHIPLCKLNMKPKSQNDFPACIFLLLWTFGLHAVGEGGIVENSLVAVFTKNELSISKGTILARQQNTCIRFLCHMQYVCFIRD